MVQILNKMVHLKYPILEIWCRNKHITQLPLSKLKFDTKLRKMYMLPTNINLAAQLCTSHSHRENMENTAPNFDCLFQPIKCKHLNPGFGYIWHLLLFSNAFSRPKVGKKLRNMSPSSLAAQLCTCHCYRRNTQSIACKF